GWFHAERPSFTAARENIAWAAVADQYFTTIVTAVPAAQDAAAQAKQRGVAVWATRFPVADAAWKEAGHSSEGNTAARFGINGALGMPGFTVDPGQSVTQNFRIYIGPREYGRLQHFPDGEADVLGFSDVSGLFSFIGPFIGFFSKTLLRSLNILHAWIGSYAVALIVLTLIIKSLLWPMQNKATQSMKRMQLLQPKMAELKERYASEPEKMSAETMKLYKDYGVNPLSGCLPMFVQIPIFFGFYNMLGKAVELRNSHFLWIDDLSRPDTIFQLGTIPVNPLPLVMAGTMFWQMAISPKSGDPAQQRMFMFMPLIFVFFCYNYASALALYWAVQNLFSVVQLYVTRNQAPPQLKRVAAKKRK
ncbi:MAG TPA: membrane protein insertase YidC, partial [Chthoniobacteraceae bacterium]|nr:membrane protein insertase YidC [Chthoniobacteraceae bacterium]